MTALHAPAQEPDKVELYRGMLLKRPENPVLFGRLVDAWLAQGEMAGLKDLLETGAAGGGPMDWRLLAVFRNFSGDEHGAIHALDEALKKSPDDALTRLARAKALGAALRFEDALADLEVAAGNPEVAMDAGTLRGKFLARAGRPAEAVQAWGEVIAAHPADEGLREDLIELEIGEGMLEEAVAAARELAEKTADPYRKALRRMRVAEILSQAGRKDDAVAEYGEVFAVSADGSWLEREVLARVNALFAREDDAAGLRGFYDRLRDTYPRRVVVKKETARSLMASGEVDESIAMFREVLKVVPGDADARDEFIAMLEVAGRLKEAADELAALLATDERNAALWEKLAAIRQSTGDEAGLKLAVDKAVSLVPPGEPGLISAAAIYERHVRPDDAEKTLRAAVKSHGISGEAGEALAVLLAKHGKPDEAVAMWREMAQTADREGLLRIARSLTAQGRAADAFRILSSRIAGSEGDPLLLAALCQAAQFSDQAETAVPQAMDLVRMAKTTGDLETALRQAMAIISRAADPRKHLDPLAAKPNPTTQELSLLAEMHESLGDSIEADRILNAAIGSGDPLMAAAQRVRLFELRGDLPSAIAATRDWLNLPGGQRTEHVKRLVSLLERSGDNEAALKETENWKRIAPGDKLAWVKRADLFTAEGFPSETVAELRRALAKFGGDEELRAKLAAALSDAGLFEESWRMSFALYEEAETPAAKLKWVGSLAEMAAREGREEELIADFKRRSRDNPSSIVPLLAMAEIYRAWNLTDEESQVIQEASRRKPADATLLHRLADLEERNGSTENAEALLQRAVRIVDTPENRRLLSSFRVRNGEAERGLAELLANGGGDPRGTERLVLSLAASRDWGTAATILAAECPRHPDDWRLAYLHATALREIKALDEAFTRFTALLDAKAELTGVSPLIPPDQMKWLGFGDSGAMDFRLFARFKMLTDRLQIQRNRMYGMSQNGEPLPGSLLELRWMALCQALTIAAENPETHEAKLATIHSTELPNLDFIISIHNLDAAGLRERMLAADADPRLFRWYFDNFNYRSNLYQNNRLDLKLLRKGVDACLTADPELALILMARLPMDGEDSLGPELAGRMLEIIAALPGDKREFHLGTLTTLSSAKEHQVPAETRQQAELMLLAHLRSDDPKTDRSLAKHQLAVTWLRSGRIDDAAAMLNGIYQDSRDPAARPRGNSIMTPYGMMPFGGWQGRTQQAELKFPEIFGSSVHHMLQAQFSATFNNGMPPPTPAHQKLLALLGEKNTGYPGQAEQPTPIEPKILAGLLPKLEDPVLRLFVAHCIGKPEPLAAEIAALEGAAKPEAEALRIAAAYHLSVGEDPAKAYQLLVAAGRLATDQPRESLDWNLFQTGVALASGTPGGADLDPARRAALRLRKRMSADDNMKRQLATGMVRLGLEQESRRYTAAPKSLFANRSRYGGTQSRSAPRASSEQVVAALVAQGKREVAARRLMADLRLLRANPNSNSHYEERQIVERISSLKLDDEIARIAQASAGAGTKTRREYALLLAELGNQDAALPLLRALAAEKPNDFEVRTTLLLVLPRDEQREYSLDLSEGDFDADRMGAWFSSAFGNTRNGGKVGDFFSNIEMLALFLEKLPPSFEPGRNLSWVNYLVKDVFDSENIGEVRLTSLRNPTADTKGLDMARSKERDALALRLYQAMLRHPQTSEQAFILMTLDGTALGIPTETLDQAALTAFSRSLRLNSDRLESMRYGGTRGNNLWMWRNTSGGSRSSGSPPGGLEPLTHLMRRAANGGSDPFSPALLAELEKDAPDTAKSLKQCLQIVEAPGIGEFAGWKDGAKNEPERIAERLLMIARLAFFRNRPDILEASMEFAADTVLAGSSGPYGVMPEAAEVFAFSVAAGKDPEATTAAVKAITTRLLGPEEGWELYGDPNNGGPQIHPIQIRSLIYRQFGEVMQQDLPGAVALARFAAAHRLGPLAGIELRRVMDSSAFRSNVAGTVGKWMDSGLFAPGPALVHSADREGKSIIESLELDINSYGNSDSKKAMAEILLKTTGPERFWARFLGAKLADKPDAAIAELDANAAAISKWPAASHTELARIFNSWFPKAEKDASAPVRKLLANSLDRGDAETRKLAEEYLKNGFPPNIQPYSIDTTLTGMLRRLMADDPELAAKIWTGALKHFNASQSGWSSTNHGYGWTLTQFANMQLMQSMGEDPLSLSGFSEFVLMLEKHSPGSSSGLFASNAIYHVRQMVSAVRSHSRTAFEADKPLAALKPDARDLAGFFASVARDGTQESRPLVAALLLHNGIHDYWSIKRESIPALNVWIERDLRKIDGDFADAALLILAYGNSIRSKDAEMPAIRAAFGRFVMNGRIPLDLRVSTINRLILRGALEHVRQDPTCVSGLARLLALGAASSPDWSSSDCSGAYQALADLEELPPASATEVLTAIKANPPDASGGHSNEEFSRMKSAMISLAVRSGDAGEVLRLAKAESESLRGNLGFLVKVWQAEATEAAVMLIARPGEYHHGAQVRLREFAYGRSMRERDRSDLPPDFDKETESRLPALLAAIEDPGQRYRIECLLASARDAQGGHAPTVNRPERIAALVKRFPAESPKALVSRNEILAALSVEQIALIELADDYARAAGTDDLGKLLPLRDYGKPQDAGRTFVAELLIRCAMRAAIDRNGDASLLLKQLKSIQSAAVGNQRRTGYDLLNETAAWHGSHLLRRMTDLPPADRAPSAAQALEIAGILLPEGDIRLKRLAVALAISSQAVNGDGAALDRWHGALPAPMKEAYDTTRAGRGLQLSMGALKSNMYYDETLEKARRALLSAFLNDQVTVNREIKHISNFALLMGSGPFSRDDMIAVLGALPENHPRRIEFLTQRAEVMGRDRAEAALVLEVYDAAATAAAGDRGWTDFVKAYRARYLDSRLKRTADALALIGTLDLAALDAPELKIVNAILKKSGGAEK